MSDTFIGQEIDGYRILEELGRGGMGVVYKAEDIALARTVALKMIARDLASDASFERRFRSEARALARIDSPNITRIYALRRTDAGLFIVMEYIGGGTVSDKMDWGPIKWDDARPIVLEMISALEHAHGVGVVHRDIKPGNILLTDSGHVKVTDFGLAKLRTGDGTATVTQGIAGTLYYMSPEQVKGDRNLDGRSDLYALGMTVYEMLSGRLPFERGGSEFETMRTIVEKEYPPLSQFVPGLPPGVSEAVMKALVKDPNERYANAAAMRAAFDAIPSGSASARAPRREAPTIVEPEPYAPSPTPVASAPAPVAASRSRTTPLLIGGGTLVTLLVAVLAYWFWPSSGGVPLSIITDPPGAVVYFNDQRIGETPMLRESVEHGTGRLRVERIGYAPVDTSLSLAEGVPVSLRFPLAALASDQAMARMLEISSTPSAATVYINGRRVGQTPMTYQDTTGVPVAVRVERAGYRRWQRTGVQLQPDITVRLTADLQRAQAEDSPPPETTTDDDDPPPVDPPVQTPGVLALSVDPGGTVRVAGQQADGSGTFNLPPGSHRVQCESSQYGSYEATVRVRSGERTTATCHFRTRVNVQANPVWGSIWIDGNSTGETTPASLMLGPGTYQVEVRRDGYRVTPPTRSISITPSLEQQTVPLIFEMEEQ